MQDSLRIDEKTFSTTILCACVPVNCRGVHTRRPGYCPPPIFFNRKKLFSLFYTFFARRRYHKRPFSISLYSNNFENDAVTSTDMQNSKIGLDLSAQATLH